MISTIASLLFIILILAFIFFKTKVAHKRPGQFHNDGRRKTFKDFQEQLANDPNGIFGEAATFQIVARVCDTDKRRYVLMRNLYIPSRGGTTEIDALLLHQSGIYVFESKNIAGEISGNLEDERWYQRLNARTQHTFHNPILQNEGHIRALQHFLKEKFSRTEFNVDETPIYSAIIFSDRCVLKQIPKSSLSKEGWAIFHFFQLQEILSKNFEKRKSIFDEKQLENLYWALEPCTRVSESVKEEHRKYVRAMQAPGSRLEDIMQKNFSV